MIAQTRLSVTLYVHSLSCVHFISTCLTNRSQKKPTSKWDYIVAPRISGLRLGTNTVIRDSRGFVYILLDRRLNLEHNDWL
jgi:hypothetical protein